MPKKRNSPTCELDSFVFLLLPRPLARCLHPLLPLLLTALAPSLMTSLIDLWPAGPSPSSPRQLALSSSPSMIMLRWLEPRPGPPCRIDIDSDAGSLDLCAELRLRDRADDELNDDRMPPGSDRSEPAPARSDGRAVGGSGTFPLALRVFRTHHRHRTRSQYVG